jgi:hypothetical protein
MGRVQPCRRGVGRENPSCPGQRFQSIVGKGLQSEPSPHKPAESRSDGRFEVRAFLGPLGKPRDPVLGNRLVRQVVEGDVVVALLLQIMAHYRLQQAEPLLEDPAVRVRPRRSAAVSASLGQVCVAVRGWFEVPEPQR